MLETKAIQGVDKYVLGTLLGSGGAAEVWKAFDPSLQRHVALKLLRTDRQSDPDFIRRFKAEARTVASLNHPNIVQIYDLSPDGFTSQEGEKGAVVTYIVMPFVEGETLADYIARTARIGKFSHPSEIARLFTTIGRAVDYAHECGVLHCDIKPANILLDQRNINWHPLGVPMLTDFGLVKALGSPVSGVLSHETGSVVGTPLYIAPEVLEGKPPTRQSDLYSLGVVAYEVCTGRLPYEFPELPSGRHPVSVVLQQVLFDPVPPSHFNHHISSLLEAVLLRGIARNPEDRFPDARAFANALIEALAVPFDVHVGLGERKGSNFGVPASIVDPVKSASSLPGALSDRRFNARSKNSQFRAKATARSRRDLHSSPSLSRIRSPLRVPLLSSYGLLISLLILLLLVVPTIFFVQGTMRMYLQGAASPPAILGQVAFLNSGQGVVSEAQGVNDEIAVNLSHLSSPSSSKSYYAWLEGDSDTSDAPAVLLGQLTVDAQGNAHLASTNTLHTYIDARHTNLLQSQSRFLVTEEDAHVVPAFPSPDKTTWRYIGAISQVPNQSDRDHFSLLDHLRHLLASDPDLDRLGLHGGLSLWLYRNAGMIQQLAQGAQKEYSVGDTVNARLDLVRILDYLDGVTLVSGDVPTGTPVLVNNTYAQTGILQLHAYQNPPSYLYHVGLHLNGLVSSPGSTPTEQKLAMQIVTDLNTAGSSFQQVRSIASQLVSLSPSQLLQQRGVADQLSNLVRLATGAYQGEGSTLHGVAWIHEQLQSLAVIPVTAYQMQ